MKKLTVINEDILRITGNTNGVKLVPGLFPSDQVGILHDRAVRILVMTVIDALPNLAHS